jgi:hypothetical protein
MFRQRTAIFREARNTNDHKSNTNDRSSNKSWSCDRLCWLVRVPQHLEGTLYHELCFTICTLLSASVGQYTEYKKTHGMNKLLTQFVFMWLYVVDLIIVAYIIVLAEGKIIFSYNRPATSYVCYKATSSSFKQGQRCLTEDFGK